MFRKVQLLLSLILAVTVTFLNTGCPDSTGGSPPVGPTRNYGPPFYDIIFLDGQDFIGSTSSEGGTDATYLKNVGSGADIGSPGIGVFCKIASRTAATQFFVKDNDNSTIEQLDENGSSICSYENVVDDLYSISVSKIIYVEPTENGYQIMKYGIHPISGTYHHGTIENPEIYSSRPAFNSDASRSVIAIKNPNSPDYDRIVVNGTGGGEYHTHTAHALSPQYSPEGGDKIAYLDAPNGAEMVDQIIIMDSRLETEMARFNFPMGLAGATTFAWSPDDVKIALFANVYGSEPGLVVVNVSQSLVVEIELGEYIPAVGSGDDLNWAYPAWNDAGNALALCVKDGENYSIITYNLIDNTILPLKTGLTAPTHVEWREYTN